jgi:pyruvate formate lyase activating enzyme
MSFFEKITRRQFLLKTLQATGLLAIPGAFSWFATKFPPPDTFSKLVSARNSLIKEARWWRSACAGVQCLLCPFECFLPEGVRGLCHVRQNVSGKLVTLVYAQPISVHIDPIEKKPIYHLLPGSKAYSLATVGCNLHCAFCQNWEISQTCPEQALGSPMPPSMIVERAMASGCRSVAYTYSEPTVFYEYVYDTALLAKQNGLKNVMVSGGYINPKPLAQLAPLFDVIKIDLKGFNEAFYRKIVGGELRFVLRTLLELKRQNTLIEIVNLVVPTLNDNKEEIEKMCKWIVKELGPETPVFFSRFTPQYKLQNLPPTPIETLEQAYKIARESGILYAYIGNVPGHPAESTYCPTCGNVLIKRYGFAVLSNKLAPGGFCPYDHTKIPGIWS